MLLSRTPKIHFTRNFTIIESATQKLIKETVPDKKIICSIHIFDYYVNKADELNTRFANAGSFSNAKT